MSETDDADRVKAAWLLTVRAMLVGQDYGLLDVLKGRLSEECSPEATKEQKKEHAARRRKYKEAVQLIREATTSLEKAAVVLGALSWGVSEK